MKTKKRITSIRWFGFDESKQIEQQMNEIRGMLSHQDSWIASTPSTSFGHSISVVGNLTGSIAELSDPAFEFVRSTVKAGLPKIAFDRAKEAIGISTEELSTITDIPVRTLARRKKLKPDESDRLIRVTSVFLKAVETFENLNRARKWFTSPKSALSGLTPLQCCDTEGGAKEIENLLGRIEEGVFS